MSVGAALALVRALEAREITAALDATGGRLRIRPASALTDADRAAIRRLRPALLVVVALASPVVGDRVAAMRARRALGEPGLVAIVDAPVEAGRCGSCGEPLAAPIRWGRCLPCAIAWRVVADIAVEAWALDAAG